MTSLHFLLALLYLLASYNALALNASRLAECAAKNNAQTRLACYDTLAKSVLNHQTIEREAVSNWLSQSSSSAQGNQRSLRLSVASDIEIEAGNNKVRPVFTVRCESTKVTVSLNWRINLGRDSIRMRTHFDDRPYRSEIWSITSDFQTVTTRGSDIAFIKQMIRHKNLKVEITPFGEKPVFAEFNISGLSEAIKPLRQSCRF